MAVIKFSDNPLEQKIPNLDQFTNLKIVNPKKIGDISCFQNFGEFVFEEQPNEATESY